MKNRLLLQKLQRGCRLRDGGYFDGWEEETDLRTRCLMKNIYGTYKPTSLPITLYAGYFTPGTNTNITKLSKENKGN